MMSVLLASALSLAAPQALPSSLPDFSGTWRMDPERSVSAVQNEPIGPITLVVRQEADRLTVQTTTARGTTTDVYRIDDRAQAAAPGQAVARWQDRVLELEAVRNISGQSVTQRQSWRLEAGGRELHVESIVDVQHGYSVLGARTYGAGVDVFVRVGAPQESTP